MVLCPVEASRDQKKKKIQEAVTISKAEKTKERVGRVQEAHVPVQGWETTVGTPGPSSGVMHEYRIQLLEAKAVSRAMLTATGSKGKKKSLHPSV